MKISKKKDEASLRDAQNLRHQESRQETREGKDEMNLVEHPFALLSSRGDMRGVIELRWEAERNGRVVQCGWRVSGDPELGLPTPFDERLYLVMLELTREAGWAQEVYFRRADLLRRLGIAKKSGSYDQVKDAFTRLHHLDIKAEHSFYNPKAKQYETLRLFSLLQRVSIVDDRGRRDEPFSHFKWSDEFYASIVAGNVRTLDLDIALSLERPLALRLLRYLDKKRHDGKPTFKIGLRKLCELHLGMVPHRYESKYRDRLTPAHEELIARGFLDGVEFQKARARGEDGLVAIYAFAPQAEVAAREVQAREQGPEGGSALAHSAPTTVLQAAVAATVAPNVASGGGAMGGASLASLTPAALLHQGRSREHEKHPQAYKSVWEGLEPEERDKAGKFGLEWHEFLRTYHDHVLIKAIRAGRK
jgi:hypothetical protein